MKNWKKSSYLAVAAIAGMCLLGCNTSKQAVESETEEVTEIVAMTETEEVSEIVETETEEPNILEQLGVEVPDLGLDWEDLANQNEHIYAWIHIPNTKVDYPILQHPTQTDYYLERNLDHSAGLPGCIYTQNMNAKDFSDANTVVYGHNMKNGTMFKGLHKFSEDEFFDTNRYFYIYTPEKTLVYEIYAAIQFTNEHIMYKYDFDTEGAVAKYRADLAKCYGNVREDMQALEDGNLVTLATCIGGKPNNRWLVVGVFLGEVEGSAEAVTENVTETTTEE